MARIKFMSIEIDNLTIEETLNTIDKLILERKNAYVVTPNVDHLVKLEKDQELQEIYEHADLVTADGKPLIWISKLYGTPIVEKVSGADLFPLLCDLAVKKNYTMFFLGAAEGVADRAAINLAREYPGLQVVGTYSPTYNFENDDKEQKEIINMIVRARPDILIVGLGAPKQEKFIYRNRNALNVPISLGLGASIDFAAGNVKRAPKWMRELGFEWLFRIFQDPKRLAKRYLIDDMKILYLIKKYKQ